MKKQSFGGGWTEEKLKRIAKYLPAYTTIFKSNLKASFLKTCYVDAFAGTGYRHIAKTNPEYELFAELAQNDTSNFLKGSARIALEVQPEFDNYLFIDIDPANIVELEKLRSEFKDKEDRIKIIKGEANIILKQWVKEVDWRKNRAVVFLDPYAMDVEWSLIESIANTKAIDLWLLFPLGAVNRTLTKRSLPPDSWKNAINRIFGTAEWENYFYTQNLQRNLFGEESVIKDADFDKIKEYFVNRLESVFTMVANNPLILRNNNKVPIFMLCFAAENPTALKIASHLLRK